MTAFTDSDYFRIEPCGPVIGAEISGIDLRNLPTGPVLGDLKRAFLDWKVLFFRGLDPTSKEHLDFARLWGEPIDFPTAEKADLPEVIVIAHGPDSPASENVWHSDVTYLQTPSTASILRAVDLPPLGGDTLWSDMAAAYDGLPDDVKERVENLTAVHDFLTRHAGRDSVRRSELSRDLFPQSDHPVVLVHPETGRRIIYVNRVYTREILGLTASENEELLELLCSQASRPEYQCRFRWTPGAIAVWDNRSTQHYAVADYSPHRRVMERVTIAGVPKR
ncbi:MAG: TauD/TfdA family dioxygenase [Streptomyces sp.]|jgi:taurine dioxygenase|uniref:TauD/TfdA dioxygenase family protein n=1 Tax=Streptomyces sp. TaxID=1931 RepID=UPI0025DE3CF7|nr:TauD/TfdA family dioxygenase [Streptomyces sp.]MBW8799882.1 TauD/TfdA family dioxygenase [Streptomyces sp.]